MSMESKRTNKMRNVNQVLSDSPTHPDTREASTDESISVFGSTDQVTETSDSDSSINSSETNDDDDEKALSKLIQNVLNGKTPVHSSSNWPSILLLQSQNSVEISPQQFQNMIIEKAADIIVNKSKLGDLMFQAKLIREEQNVWKKKFQNLTSQVKIMHKKLEQLDRRPPVPTITKVRSVGTYVNMLPTSITANNPKPLVTCKIKDPPTIITID